jgi:REP-associated tyrosine transposase
MGHTYTRLITHIIFSTKDRLPYIRDERRDDVFAYIGGIVRNLKGTAINVNGAADHVHVLVRLPAALAIAKASEIIKANSSRWIHDRRVLHRTFAWQSGYAAFSVSESNVDRVSRYISNQQEHHRRATFQEELIEFLKRSGIDYDERYLWK